MANKRKQLMDFVNVNVKKYESGRIIQTEINKKYILQRLLINEEIPAYLLKPIKVNNKYKPLLYCHANPDNKTIGKDELINGIEELQYPPYADILIDRGFVVMCIDNLGFGERSDRSLDSYYKEYIWKGKNLWGKFLSDNLVALDYLLSLDNVDNNKATVLGFSMGSTLAYWLAAVETRIKLCIDICGLSDYDEINELEEFDCRGHYFYIYNIFNNFKTQCINELIIPRKHYSFAGVKDPRTQEPGLDKIDSFLKVKYEEAGFKNNWKLYKYNSGHIETKEIREQVVNIIEREVY